MKIAILNKAKRDMRDIFVYISMRSDMNIAQNQINKMIDSIKLLETTPNIGSWVKNITYHKTDHRFLVSGRYIIFYKIIDNSKIQITRVLDGRRDWQSILFGH